MNTKEKKRQQDASYYRRNTERCKTNARNYALRVKYGLTPEGFEALKASQNYLCRLCTVPLANDLYGGVVDHDHNTGAVRGVLCTQCNVGLGNLKDSAEILQRAIEYLNVSPAKQGTHSEVSNKPAVQSGFSPWPEFTYVG